MEEREAAHTGGVLSQQKQEAVKPGSTGAVFTLYNFIDIGIKSANTPVNNTVSHLFLSSIEKKKTEGSEATHLVRE